jgi:hypothetical protein
MLALACGVVAVHVATGIPAGPWAAETRTRTSVFESRHARDSWEVFWHDGDRHLRLRMKGQIELSDDWSEVLSISPRGYLDIKADEGEGERRVRLEGERDGGLSRRWWVEGEKHPFDDEARAWLASMLPQVARRTGFQAGGRVEKLLNERGVEGVLAEIEKLESDHIRHLYYSELRKRAGLRGVELARVLEHAGRTMASDFEIARFLVETGEALELDGAAAEGYARAVRRIGSDSDKGRALRALIEQGGPEALQPMLEAAEGIDSDHELAELLVEAVRRRDLDAGSRDAFFAAVETLGSDFEQRRVLQALADRGGPEWMRGILAAAERDLESDHEHAELLHGIARRGLVPPEAEGAFLAALGTIGCDHDYRRVAGEFASRHGVSEAGLAELLRDAARHLESDHEMAELLVGVAHEYRLAGDVRQAYLEACGSIRSTYDNQRAVAALVEGESTSRSQ